MLPFHNKNTKQVSEGMNEPGDDFQVNVTVHSRRRTGVLCERSAHAGMIVRGNIIR